MSGFFCNLASKFLKKLTNLLVPILYPLSSLSLVFVVYLINNGVDFVPMVKDCCHCFTCTCNCNCCWCILVKNYGDAMVHIGSYVLYFLIAFLMMYGVKLLFGFLNKDQEPEVQVSVMEASGRDYMPTYLSYFFIALSINTVESLFVCFIILYILTFFATTMAYNPLMLLLGYRFYSFRNANGKQIMVFTKRNVYCKEKMSFNNLGRINNFTYVDLDTED